MRKILAVLVCLATQPAIQAQSEAWNAYLESWKRTPRGALNLLLSSAAPLGSHRASDEVFLQLVSARDVALEVLEGGELERVTSARGWDRGSRWILLDARGRTLLEGSALPTGEALRSQLLTQGRTPTWEALEQFLRSHPDSGDALQRRLGIAYRMSVARFRSLRTAGKGEGFTAATDSRFPIFKPATVMDPEAARGISREVLDTLHRDCAKPLRIEKLAQQSGLSWSQFQRRVRGITGLTPRQLLTKSRIEAAAQALLTTDESLSAISFDCGFYDQAAFSRQFKDATGLTPGEYRRAVRA